LDVENNPLLQINLL